MLSEKDKQYLKKLNEKIHSVDSNYRTSAPIVGEEKGRNIFVLRHELEIVKDNILEYGKDYTDKYNEMKEYLDKSLKLVDKFIEQVVNIKEYITKLENGEISVNEIYEIFSDDRYKTSYKEDKEYFTNMDPNDKNYYSEVLMPMLINDLYYPSMNNLFTLCNTIYKNILANGSIEYMLKSEPIKKIRNDYYKDYAEDENVSANFNIINGEFVNDWNRIVINNLYKDGDVNTGAYHVFKIDPSYDGDLNSLTKGNDVIDIVLGKNNGVLIAQTVGKGVSFNRHNFNNEPVFPKIIKSNPTSVNQLKTKTNPYGINNAVLFEQASFIEKSEVEGSNTDISDHPEVASVEKIADKILGNDNVYSLFNNKCFYRRETVELVEDIDDNYPNSKLHIDSAFNNSNVESDGDIFEDEAILPKIVSKSNEKVTYFMIPNSVNKMSDVYNLYGCGAASSNQLGTKLEDGTVGEDLLCEEFVDNNDNYIYDEVIIEKFLLDNNENRTQNMFNQTMYAKTTDRKLITFGVNVSGECGHGDLFNDNFIMTKNNFIPKKVVVSGGLDSTAHFLSQYSYATHTTYIIDENDNLWVSGRNTYGECGDGTGINLLNFKKIDMLDGLISDISSSSTRTVLKTKNDDLYMCGRLNGENILTWKKIDQFDNKVDKIYSSWNGTFVIDKEKNLWLIGDLSGSSGDTNRPTWFKVEELNGVVKEVCCIRFDIYVIDINNNLWTLGSGNGNDDKNAKNGVWNKIEKFNGIVDKVWLSYNSVFIKDIHKNIWVFSSSYFGFNNIEYDESIFNKINLLDIDVEEIYTHYNSVFIKDVDGFLYSLSGNSGETSIVGLNVYIPLKLNFLTNIKSINVNIFAIFVLLENGDIWMMGRFNNHRKRKINNYQWKKITNNGKLRVAKHNRISNIHDDNVALIKTPDGAYYATGANQYGQCGLGHKNQVNSFTQVNLDGNQFDKIVSFQSTYYGIDKRKNLWVVGDNQYGQCGLGNLENVTKWTKVSTFNENVKEVFACNGCAFVIDDEDYLWSVGSNVMGGLGNGENKTTFSKDTTIQKAKYVVGNFGTTYVVDLNNTLWTSGFNQNGQCGIGSSEMFIKTWNKITLFEGKVDSIHASVANVYVIDSDNNFWVCGSNGFGECGDGTTTDVKTFKKLSSLTNKVKNVSLGYRTVYITDKNRELYVFGSNDQFQCGNNAASNKDHLKTPTKITGDFSGKIKKIVAGQYNAYILDTLGNVYVAGFNQFGQCGIDTDMRCTFGTSYTIRSIVINEVKNKVYIIGNFFTNTYDVFTEIDFLTNKDINYFITNEYIAVAVSKNGTVYSSEDGVKWTENTTLKNIKEIYLWKTDNMYVAIDKDDYLWTSNIQFSNHNYRVMEKITEYGKVKFLSSLGSPLFIIFENDIILANYNLKSMNNKYDYNAFSIKNSFYNSNIYSQNIKMILSNLNENKVFIYDDKNIYTIHLDMEDEIDVKFKSLKKIYTTKHNIESITGVFNYYSWTYYDLISIKENDTYVIKKITEDDKIEDIDINKYGKVLRIFYNFFGLVYEYISNIDSKIRYGVLYDEILNEDVNLRDNKIKYGLKKGTVEYDYDSIYDGDHFSTLQDNIKTWTKVPNLSSIFEIYAGADTAYAIDIDKKIYVTGKNDVGQCGDGTTTDVTTWKLLPKLNKSITTFPKSVASNITDLYFGSRSSLFYLQKLNNGFSVFGKNTPNLSIADFSDHGIKEIVDDTLDISPIHDNYNLSESVFFKVKDKPISYKCIGNNKEGVCGFTSAEHTSILTPIDMVFPENGDIKDLKLNFNSSMCLFTNGNLYVAGSNSRANLGITETNTSAVGWKKVIIPNIFDYKVLKILYFSYISSIILVKYKEAADSEVYSYGIFATGENTKGNLGVTGEKLTEFTKIPVSFDVRNIKYCDTNQDDINNVNSITWILLDNGELYYSSSNYTNSNGAFVKIKDNVDFKEDKYGETEMNKYIYDGFVTPYHNGIAYLDKTNTLHVLDLLDDAGTLSEKTVPNVSNFSVFRQESEVFANKTLVNTMSYVTKDKQLYYRGSHDTENLFGISGSQRVTDFTRIDTNRVEMTNKVLMSKVVGGGMVIAYTVNRDFYAAGGPQTNCYHLGIVSDPDSLEPIVNFKRIPFLKVNSTIKYRLNSPYEKLELDKSGLVKLLNVR